MEGTPHQQSRVDTLSQRFPKACKVAIAPALRQFDGHGGKTTGTLQDPTRARAQQKAVNKPKRLLLLGAAQPATMESDWLGPGDTVLVCESSAIDPQGTEYIGTVLQHDGPYPHVAEKGAVIEELDFLVDVAGRTRNVSAFSDFSEATIITLLVCNAYLLYCLPPRGC
jgi:hypothetical protein